jgi:tRNA (mo5U34)-methyltransferase
MLKSKVEHQRCAAEDIDAATLGTFDLVLFLGVFYHLRSPIQVLDRIRAVTTGTLICETHALVPAFHEKYPLVSFFPGDGLEAGLKYEFSSEPTIEAMRQMLRSSGFTQVDVKHMPSMRWLKKIKAAITTRPESGRLIVHAS